MGQITLWLARDDSYRTEYTLWREAVGKPELYDELFSFDAKAWQALTGVRVKMDHIQRVTIRNTKTGFSFRRVGRQIPNEEWNKGIRK